MQPYNGPSNGGGGINVVLARPENDRNSNYYQTVPLGMVQQRQHQLNNVNAQGQQLVQQMNPLAAGQQPQALYQPGANTSAGNGLSYPQYISIDNSQGQSNGHANSQYILSEIRAQALTNQSMLTTFPPSKSAESHKKRLARNEREQKRAHRIAQVIEEIKEMLERGSFPLKSSSKYHILSACEEMIRSLEMRTQSYEMEKQLRDAVARSIEGIKIGQDQKAVIPTEVDYYQCFQMCNVPMAVASKDGRILSTNAAFDIITGRSERESEDLTIFSLIAPDQLKESYSIVGRLISEKNSRDYSLRSYLRNTHGTFYTLILSLVFEQPSTPSCFHVSLVDEDYGMPHVVGANGQQDISTASVISNDSSSNGGGDDGSSVGHEDDSS
mmetsp:Transcript_15322/g.24155  ORF Transcript_15322/g.24155 Transcript_15322/m.24155 type:complete len:384 (+) Transcript_15322:130-1281(+)|eukprot:CAMPEP_0194723802 /NCGR_PEP_ID=MMETSP0296-20130528/14771_1 /TAXON_ID=39354 /ORGANISM="Heterosigma akashiwo, Strain CCMP2393" /LENGTH=383 /DNA_ID=CAMNT_0039627363 /DNA_START=143 /DNA_END=1294 /DNA_ORIENTATION=+